MDLGQLAILELTLIDNFGSTSKYRKLPLKFSLIESIFSGVRSQNVRESEDELVDTLCLK